MPGSLSPGKTRGLPASSLEGCSSIPPRISGLGGVFKKRGRGGARLISGAQSATRPDPPLVIPVLVQMALALAKLNEEESNGHLVIVWSGLVPPVALQMGDGIDSIDGS